MNKLILSLSALTILAISSCNKKSSYRADAQIIGYDGTMCGCCLGFMVKLSDDNGSEYNLARTLPASAGINPASSFPINVEIDYDQNDENCERVIEVTRLRKK